MHQRHLHLHHHHQQQQQQLSDVLCIHVLIVYTSQALIASRAHDRLINSQRAKEAEGDPDIQPPYYRLLPLQR